MKRAFIESKANYGVTDAKFIVCHTRLRDSSIPDEKYRATMAIVHGFAENSDIHLESAIQYALNGYDVQLIDLRGYGLSGGYRMTNNRVHDFHYDVTVLLQQCNPNLPLFIYGHSMGGLTICSYLINNTNLNISGVILSAPLLAFSDTKGIDDKKKALVKTLAPHLEVSFEIFKNTSLGICC